MKKKILLITTTLLFVFTLVSCSTARFDDYYTVVFFTNGNDYIETVEVDKGGILARPRDPNSEIAEFDNWYTDKSHTKLFPFDEPINESITIYAKWTFVEYTITYAIDAETVNDARNVTTYTKSLGRIRIRPATKEGARFLSWHLTPDLSGPKVDYLDADDITEDITLYPNWR